MEVKNYINNTLATVKMSPQPLKIEETVE